MNATLEQPNTSMPDGARSAPAYHVGDIRIAPAVVLAPMAAVTNGAYRRLVKRIGNPGLLVTELLSTEAIKYKSRKTMSMFDVTDDQRPLAVQLFGSEPSVMAEAARVAVGEGADIIDINMGCWVPKVCKTGGGAAMMKDEATAVRVVEAIVRPWMCRSRSRRGRGGTTGIWRRSGWRKNWRRRASRRSPSMPAMPCRDIQAMPTGN